MLRPTLLAATLALAGAAAHAELLRIDYQVAFDREFDHLGAITTDLTGQTATGSIVFDTANVQSTSSDALSTVVVFGATSTWDYAGYPTPPSTSVDNLALTFYLSGGFAGQLNGQGNLGTTWSPSPGITHELGQNITLNGTYFMPLSNPASPTAGEILNALQTTVGQAPTAFYSYHKHSSADMGTLAYSDVIGTVTVTAVTAVPEPQQWLLLGAGLGAMALPLLRRHRRG
ncbi:MAG: hypothetical protein HZB72_12180 [Burkholderiales bacterium]|nr:hypothetical protein [Burkholderiales bacterium]